MLASSLGASGGRQRDPTRSSSKVTLIAMRRPSPRLSKDGWWGPTRRASWMLFSLVGGTRLSALLNTDTRAHHVGHVITFALLVSTISTLITNVSCVKMRASLPALASTFIRCSMLSLTVLSLKNAAWHMGQMISQKPTDSASFATMRAMWSPYGTLTQNR